MHKPIRWASVAMFSLALAGAGVASAGGKDKPAKSGTTSSATCPMDDAAKLKTVLTFLHTANQNEIKHAKLAVDRAQSPEVKSFADRLMREHTDGDKRLTDLAQKKGIDLTPAMTDDPVRAAVSSHEAKMEQALSAKKGAAFDATFVGSESMKHGLALAVIEEGQKVAKDEEDKRFLSDTHAALTQHKEQASSIIDKMKTTVSTAIGGGPGSETKTKPEKAKPPEKPKTKPPAENKDWITPEKSPEPMPKY